ncbi:MAG: hypothetical protein IJ666_01610 [Ruminococcus sp.]|nr:hypothetical protein [Ruminococcus sp.]
MKLKKMAAAVLSALTVFSCSTPIHSFAWGWVKPGSSVEDMEKKLDELYGGEFGKFKEFEIYGYSDIFDGVSKKVFKLDGWYRSGVVARYDGTLIYMTTENKAEVKAFIEENYPDYYLMNDEEEYDENGYNFVTWTYDYDESGKDISDICNALKERNLISAFDYKFGGYSFYDMMFNQGYLTGYPTKYSDAMGKREDHTDELMQKLSGFVEENNLDFDVVLFDTLKMRTFGDGVNVPFYEMPSYVDAEGKYPDIFFDTPHVCVIPNEGVSDYEQSVVARRIKEEFGLDSILAWDQAIGDGGISFPDEHIDIFNAVLGDANNDGKMSISDAVAVL